MSQGAAPPTPTYLNGPFKFSPAYVTTNADGAIGNGVFSATFQIVGSMMRLSYCLLLGNTTAAGTGELILPLPPDWLNPDNLDVGGLPEVQAFVHESRFNMSRNVGAVVPGVLQLINFGNPPALLLGVVTQMGLSVAGDKLYFDVDVPLLSPFPAPALA